MSISLPGVASFARATAVLLMLLGWTQPAAAQFPILYTWPGPSPCNGTLQACVDAATADDTVEIATNGPIDEEIVSYGSLDLQAAFGFTPRFASGRSIRASSSGAADQAIRIQGLTLDGGSIDVDHLSNGGALIVNVLNNVVENFTRADAAIDVRTTDSGPLVFRIDGNEIECGSGGAPGGIRVTAEGGFATGDVERNGIRRAVIGTGGYGIDLYVQDGALTADVFANVVSFDGGEFGVRARGAVLNTRIVGNAIEYLNLETSRAISIFDPQAPDGSIDTMIVNNTTRHLSNGIVIESGGDALVANNLLSGIFLVGLAVRPAQSQSPLVSNRNNLFWDITAADVEGTTAGPGSVFENPGLNFDDFRIPASSPAADAGDSASLPPGFPTDLYGDTRVQGASIDIGAVEAPEPRAALASLIGLAACAALHARQRRLAFRERSERLRQPPPRAASRCVPS
jgi:hypothetical protein